MVKALLRLCLVVAVSAARLHVEKRAERYIIADELGRERLLGGINVATLGEHGGAGSQVPIDPALYEHGRCPVNDNSWYQPPICETDMKQLAAHGFDSIRLLVHWAQIEPTPGQFSEIYFARINQVIDWAEVYGVDVVIDFHQDNFANVSTFCCADDGAPGWAWLVNETLADLSPAKKEEVKELKKLVPSLDWDGAMIAFFAFWHNSLVPATGRGLQSHYIEAVGMMVNRTMNRSAVVGWEIMNEPLPGESTAL
jgi:hypothetical protein